LSEQLQHAVADALGYLRALEDEQLRPHEARRRLDALRARHPEIGLELVWEEEAYDGSVHYDVLLRPGDRTTVSVSSCRDGALPWPLRGVRRWSDADLAQVNGKVLKMQDAVSYLDVVWEQAPIGARLIEIALVREELDRHAVEVDDEELQRGLDGLRRTHKLHDAASTRRWMQDHGVSHEQLEQLALDSLTYEKLRARVTEGLVERYFEDHRAELDTVFVAQLECVDEASAGRLASAIAAGATGFFEAAQQQFLATPAQVRIAFATVRRRDAGVLAGAIFAAAVGDLVGPTRVGDRSLITRVLSRIPARLDEPTRAAVTSLVFEDWLAERRRTAEITWFWGTSNRSVPT
jgi:putative peptide maturation system protein